MDDVHSVANLPRVTPSGGSRERANGRFVEAGTPECCLSTPRALSPLVQSQLLQRMEAVG